MNPKSFYFEGKYDAAIELSNTSSLPEDHVFQIASLYMLGRSEEATVLMQKNKWENNHLLMLLFFCSLSLLRRSQYQEARKKIKEAYFLFKKAKKNDFYFFQLIAFYLYFKGSFKKSLEYALKALQACDDEAFVYEKIYSMDIIGHIYFQTGEFFKSIDFLEKTKNYAIKIKCKGTAQAIETTVIGYCLESGFELEENIKKAKAIIAQAKTKEFYLRAQIQLQLSKAYLLSGNIDLMNNTLRQASYNIYRTQNNRQLILLNILLVIQHKIQGEFERALFFIRNAKQLIHKKTDTILNLRLISLELSLLKEMGHESKELEKERRMIIKRTSYYLEQINEYYKGNNVDISFISDPIFLLMKDRKNKDLPEKSFILKLDHENLLGLLYQFNFPKNQTILYFGIKKNRILIFHKNNIFWSRKNLTKFQYDFIKFLFKHKELSKRSIIESFWNYKYINYHHDKLIYNLIARIRKSDPRLGVLIQTLGNVFVDKKIVIYGLKEKKLCKLNENKIKEIPSSNSNLSLNYRQTQLLETLALNSYISPKEYASLFEVSRITATRDLIHLKEDGFLKTIGRARSLRYIRI